MNGFLFYSLLVVGVLLAAILLVPIQFYLQGGYAQGLTFEGRIRWAGGVLGLEIIRREGIFCGSLDLLGIKRPVSLKARKSRDKSKKPAGGKGSFFEKFTDYINRHLLNVVKVMLRRMQRALHLNIRLSGIYGFDDPSLTGITMGMLAALLGSSTSIDLNPDFSEAHVDIHGNIRGWFIPLQILAIGLVFSLQKPVRAIWWPKIKIRKKQKEAFQYV